MPTLTHSYRALYARLAAMNEHVCDVRMLMAHAAQNAPRDYPHSAYLQKSLVLICEVSTTLSTLLEDAHNRAVAEKGAEGATDETPP